MKEGKTMKKVQKMLCSLMVILLLAGGVIPTNNSVITPAITVEAAVSKKQTAKFVRAIDGDTAKLKVKGKTYTFRFLAVDTPETKKPNTPVAFMGKRASNYTKTALKKAKNLLQKIFVRSGLQMDFIQNIMKKYWVNLPKVISLLELH